MVLKKMGGFAGWILPSGPKVGWSKRGGPDLIPSATECQHWPLCKLIQLNMPDIFSDISSKLHCTCMYDRRTLVSQLPNVLHHSYSVHVGLAICTCSSPGIDGMRHLKEGCTV
jgi:hypothetical protein